MSKMLHPTSKKKFDELIFHECPKCDSIHVTLNNLHSAVKNYEKSMDPLTTKKESSMSARRWIQQKMQIIKLKCPQCKKDMESMEYSEESLIQIQSCKPCKSIWLEKYQLSQISHYLENHIEPKELQSAFGSYRPQPTNISPDVTPVLEIFSQSIIQAVFDFIGGLFD